MNIKFQVDADRLTLNDLIALEEENSSPRFQRDFLARFVVDNKGKYIEEETARQMVGNLSMTELVKALEGFQAAAEKLQDNIVPKVNASP